MSGILQEKAKINNFCQFYKEKFALSKISKVLIKNAGNFELFDAQKSG